MIHVIATIELTEDSRERFLAEFHRIIDVVRDEDGCVEYGPAIDLATSVSSAPARENVVTVIEKWTNTASLEAHLKAPHMATYRDRVKDIVRSVNIQVLAPA
ncbi:MAG: antibiotic biosynthesis monooxygenase [Planctomycetaceae bacterium]|nr:antibiotic biosynthesis monooxygenase [Planctomycetaceae bacterium]